MSINSFFRSWSREITTGVLAGIMTALSFPPYPTRFFSLFSLVPLFLYFLSREGGSREDRSLKRGFLTCYIFGVVFFGILLHWIAGVIPDSNVTARWVLAPGVTLLVLYLALFPGLFGLAMAWLVRRYGSIALAAAPAVYPVTEFFRSSGELGFSWGTLSGSLIEYPFAVQGLSLYGSYGLSLVLVLVNLLLATVIFSRAKRMKLAGAAVLIAVVALHVLFGLKRVDKYSRMHEESSGGDIAVVQPNVGLDIKWEPEYKDQIFREIEELTSRAATNGASLVIFPETSAPVSITRSPGYRRLLERSALRSGVDLLVGFIDHQRLAEEVVSYNAAGLFSREGRLSGKYRKKNLLPFGEKIPFSQHFPVLEDIRFGQANFRSGEDNTLFSSESGNFGILICFESTFQSQSREYVRNGADFLVNITNDGWFNGRRGPVQHSETAIIRAVENGVPMLRSANTGVSMHIDPAGTVVERIGLDREGIIYCRVTETQGSTLFTRFGNIPFLIMAALSVAVSIAGSRFLSRGAGRQVQAG